MLVQFHFMGYSLKRSLSALGRLDRLRFGCLEAALYTYCNDVKLTASGTPLDYIARVSDWRKKRAINPARYWWQGLSRGWLDRALPDFFESEKDELSRVLTDFVSFKLRYEQACCGSGQVQQALGLVGTHSLGSLHVVGRFIVVY